MNNSWIRHETRLGQVIHRTYCCAAKQLSSKQTFQQSTTRLRRYRIQLLACIDPQIGINRGILSQQPPSFCRTFAKQSNNKPNDDTKQNHETRISNNRKALMLSWMQEWKSPPNIITSIRILSAPFLSYFIVHEYYEWALWGCFVASVSDWMDGWMARTFSMNTVLGSYLDPLADKALVNTVAVSLWYVQLLPTPLVALWALRDVGLCIGTVRYVTRVLDEEKWTSPFQVSATPMSKLNTSFQFVTLSVALLQPIYGIDPSVLEAFWYV